MNKLLGGTVFIFGIFLLAGTAGSSDFYEECLAAVDCVAFNPMSSSRMFGQLIFGVFLLAMGAVYLTESE